MQAPVQSEHPQWIVDAGKLHVLQWEHIANCLRSSWVQYSHIHCKFCSIRASVRAVVGHQHLYHFTCVALCACMRSLSITNVALYLPPLNIFVGLIVWLSCCTFLLSSSSWCRFLFEKTRCRCAGEAAHFFSANFWINATESRGSSLLSLVPLWCLYTTSCMPA